MTDRPFVLDDLHRVVTPTETSISPDGTVAKAYDLEGQDLAQHAAEIIADIKKLG